MARLRNVLILACIIGLLFSLPAFSADPIKIGSVLRLSTGAEHGIPAKRGVAMAVDEFNKAGGLKGQKVEVIFEDEKDSPTAAVNAVQKLVNADKTFALELEEELLS